MNEVYKVAVFKLRLSNRKKHLLKNIMVKFTNAMGDVLKILQPTADDIEMEVLSIKTTRKGDNYFVDTNKITRIVNEAINRTVYKSYRHRERLVQDISYNLASFFELRLKGKRPSYPVKFKIGNSTQKDVTIKDLYTKLTHTGISENGIEEDAHTQEVDIISEIIRIQKDKLQPIPFIRYRDFQIFEQKIDGKTPKRIALLNIISGKAGKEYTAKNNIDKRKYSGYDLASTDAFTSSSITKLPCVLEWSLFHELNFFKIGTPKTAKLIYDEENNDFYLHITFQFLPHVDEDGTLHYIKTSFDEERTKELESNIERGKKKKARICYDALTGEQLNVASANKTTENKTRETTSYLGVDLGRIVLAAFAIVKDGKVLYKDFAETISLSKKLYGIYDQIALLQKEGKQNKKYVKDLYKKIEYITKQSIHRTANRLIWARDYYNAQLILENLNGLKSLPQKKVQQYAKLADILTYKSQLKGFPLNTYTPARAYLEIYPAQTSKLCSKCGYTHPNNRRIEMSQKDFKCVLCGFESNSDINAAINIARLGEYTFKFKDKFINFDYYLKDLAGCCNASYDTYRELVKMRSFVYDISRIIEKQIKKQSTDNKLYLKDVL